MPLSAEDRAVCEEAFKLHESSPGVIPATALGECMRCPGANPSEEEVQALLGGKNSVKFEDYIAIMEKQTLHEDPTTALQDGFTIFDSTGSGQLDALELRNVIGNLGERFTIAEVEEMMRVPEIGADHKLSYNDLVSFAAKHR
eukprot:m.479115 g.479115  ORF g.479115 m.479115 type:complete len:143 (+) comp21322_c0_seq1:475-903(+)